MNTDIQKLSKQLTRWYQEDFYLLHCFFTGFFRYSNVNVEM